MQAPPSSPAERLAGIRARITGLAGSADVRLLAVSKGQRTEAVRELAQAGQHAFGENYVQEALAKQRQLADPALEWHFIGPLQSNKCREIALHFDWLQSLDRDKLIEPLVRNRPAERGPLQVLIQVKIGAEPGKSGCDRQRIAPLAAAIAARPQLRLRGLMSIPPPHADPTARRHDFIALRRLFDTLRRDHPGCDTLSMGMSEDFELAIAEGATLVRIGTALFGSRDSQGRDSGSGIEDPQER